jgi:hypothetical protein
MLDIFSHLIFTKETIFQKLAQLLSLGKSMKPTLLAPLDGEDHYHRTRDIDGLSRDGLILSPDNGSRTSFQNNVFFN